METLFGKIQSLLPVLSEAKRSVGRYLLENWQEASFLTASRLAHKVGVSESVIVRFAQDLGYSGFPDLQGALQHILRNRLTAISTREETASASIISEVGEFSLETQSIFDLTVNNLKANRLNNSLDSFEKAIDRIMRASKIAVIGCRNAKGPATLLAVHLNEIFTNAALIDSGLDEMFDRLRALGTDDLLITIGLPTYASQTVLAAEFAAEHDVPQVTITDSLLSPLSKLATVTLLTSGKSYSFANSHVGTLFLIDILLYLLTIRGKGKIFKSLEEINVLNQRYDLVRT